MVNNKFGCQYVTFEESLAVQNLYSSRLCCRSIVLFPKSLVSVLHTVLSLLDHEFCESDLLMSNLVSLKAWESACLLDISGAIPKSLTTLDKGVEEFILTPSGFLLSPSKELPSKTRTFFLRLQTMRKADSTGLLIVSKLLTTFKGTFCATIYMCAVTCQVICFLLNVRD